MKIAIITGASSGLGREYARQIDRSGEVEEIWAVARRELQLNELADELKCRVRPLALDLTDKASIDKISGLLRRENPEVHILINAAGFGREGGSFSIPREDNENMIDLNCRAAVDMTSEAVPYMRKGGRILELCSCAGFMPLPRLNIYAASKAFLLSYTKAIHHELLFSGINVTAVCPYWVKKTEFLHKMKKYESKNIRHFPFASRPPSVVRWSMAASRMNVWVVSPNPFSMCLRLIAKFIPHFILVPLWDVLRHV